MFLSHGYIPIKVDVSKEIISSITVQSLSEIDNFFFQEGFIKSKSDPNIFIRNNGNRNVPLISMYVDDLIIEGSAINVTKEIEKQLF